MISEREFEELSEKVEKLDTALSVLSEKLFALEMSTQLTIKDVAHYKDTLDKIDKNVERVFAVLDEKSKSPISFFMNISSNVVTAVLVSSLMLFFGRG